MAVILGEFGVPDHGKPKTSDTPNPATGSNSNHADSAVAAADGDFSSIADVDVTFLQDLAEYLRGLEVQGASVSWFWWAWNANSGGAFRHSTYKCAVTNIVCIKACVISGFGMLCCDQLDIS
jgi:hypothetical protein